MCKMIIRKNQAQIISNIYINSALAQKTQNPSRCCFIWTSRIWKLCSLVIDIIDYITIQHRGSDSTSLLGFLAAVSLKFAVPRPLQVCAPDYTTMASSHLYVFSPLILNKRC